MFTELAEIHIQPGTDAAFLAAIAQAGSLFQRARGCTAMRIEKRVEDADCYLLVVGWETLDNYHVRFRESANIQTDRHAPHAGVHRLLSRPGRNFFALE